MGGGRRLRGPVVRLCTTCLTDLNQLRARGVSHCASSGACVLAIEGYHDFIGEQQKRSDSPIVVPLILLMQLSLQWYCVVQYSTTQHLFILFFS